MALGGETVEVVFDAAGRVVGEGLEVGKPGHELFCGGVVGSGCFYEKLKLLMTWAFKGEVLTNSVVATTWHSVDGL